MLQKCALHDTSLCTTASECSANVPVFFQNHVCEPETCWLVRGGALLLTSS